MNMESLWFVEWSEDQKCFNVELMNEVLKRNFQLMAEGNGGGYIPIAICKTIHEANMCCEESKKFLDKNRPEARS